MDPNTLLTFTEPKIGVPFGLALVFGLALACGAFLLRPWPPKARRAMAFAAVLAFCASAAWLLVRNREVQIDLARGEVRESVEGFGLGKTRSWPLSALGTVVVERSLQRAQAGGPRADAGAATHDRYHVGVQIGDEVIEIHRIDEVLDAEALALGLAQTLDKPAVRRGYRLESSTAVGQTQPFATTDGRAGVAVSLDALVRVLDAPDHESAIAN